MSCGGTAAGPSGAAARPATGWRAGGLWKLSDIPLCRNFHTFRGNLTRENLTRENLTLRGPRPARTPRREGLSSR